MPKFEVEIMSDTGPVVGHLLLEAHDAAQARVIAGAMLVIGFVAGATREVSVVE